MNGGTGRRDWSAAELVELAAAADAVVGRLWLLAERKRDLLAELARLAELADQVAGESGVWQRRFLRGVRERLGVE